MQAKKRQEKILSVPELKSQITEIIVANGRSFQPFIRTFEYTGENVTKSNLGTLIGVFEIDEISEDCAYIVNFLASVAKKEYFSNPRRGAIESFESALHKINLALSELVKHGNVSWLGKLHGTIGVLEKNNIHFSVTGQAAILLLRNDEVSDISADLASPESHLHPIKTFVEVSSGRLSINDRVLFTSPELLALFSIEELTKNARRMDSEQFMQFLKTALVNELDMAGTILIEFTEQTIVESRVSKKSSDGKSLERISNIFSQSAFLPKKQSAPVTTTEEAHSPAEKSNTAVDEEYVDTKTGHIYVQGITPQQPTQHARLEQFMLGVETLIDRTRLFVFSQEKWIRKGKKQLALTTTLAGETLHATGKQASRAIRRKWKQLRTPKMMPPAPSQNTDSGSREQKNHPKLYPVSDISLGENTPLLQDETLLAVPEAIQPTNQEETLKSELPKFLKEKLNLFYQKKPAVPITHPSPSPVLSLFSHIQIITTNGLVFTRKNLKRAVSSVQTIVADSLTRIKDFSIRRIIPPLHTTLRVLKELPVAKKQVLFGLTTTLLMLILGLSFWLGSPSQRDTLLNKASDQSPSLSSKTPLSDVTSAAPTVILDNTTELIVASVILNGQTYAITEKSIIAVTDKKSFPLPPGSTARFATAMDDLRLLFIYTQEEILYAWSPISKTFVINSLALAEGAGVAGIDTYLTYLYVLDNNNDQVYRFPRADSGFGASTSWLRESVTIEGTTSFAVNESLYIALDSTTIKGFFRGRATNTFEFPPAGLEVTDLHTHPGLQNVYALDVSHHQILIWNQDGQLLHTIIHEKISEGRTLSVNEATSEVFVSTENSLLSYSLK